MHIRAARLRIIIREMLMLEIGPPEKRGTPNEERQKMGQMHAKDMRVPPHELKKTMNSMGISDEQMANEPTHVPERHGLKKSVRPMKPMARSERTSPERPSNIPKPSNQLGSVMISPDDFPDPDEPLRDPEIAQYKQTTVGRNPNPERKDTIVDNPDIDKTQVRSQPRRNSSDLDISKKVMASLTPEEYAALKDQLGLPHTGHG